MDALIKHNMKALKKLREFKPELSLCPICGSRFKGCHHTLLEAKTVLRGNIWAVGTRSILF